ncbi:FAD linked oxidase protein [Rutstroemia sp. NJR-2017a BVV2]|nr:FAD linked oxidase protein [Rutstroemia sp. NJR-2017a BVV2]
MDFLRITIQTLALAGAGSTAFWQLQTHNSNFIPHSASDSIFHSLAYLQTKPNKNPATHDLCARKVPLEKIKPQLLKQPEEGKPLQPFCAGIWSGWGEFRCNFNLEQEEPTQSTAINT